MPDLGPIVQRVLMTTDTAGGVWDYSLELAAGLRRRGVRTILAIMGSPILKVRCIEARAIPDLQLEFGEFKLEWMANPEEDVASASEWLLKLAHQYEPDLVHINSYAFASLPWHKPCVLAAHSCILSWWNAVKKTEIPEDFDWYRGIVASGLQLADGVVFPTNSLRNQMERIYGPIQNSEVILNGKDPFRYKPGRKKRFIFSAGRLWDEAKNVSALEHVSAHLRWPTLIAGDWKKPDGSGNAPQRITYLGFLAPTRMAEFYAEASIFVSPARYEPFGLAVLEAALSGCALVLGNIPTFRELWDDAALFVDPDDLQGLKHALTSLTEDQRKLETLARKARERALRYSGEAMAGRYYTTYSELCMDYALLSESEDRSRHVGPELQVEF